MATRFKLKPGSAVKAGATLALLAALLASVTAAQAAGPSGPVPTSAQVRLPHRAGLDDRVELLARELDLDTHQRVEVRKLLVAQREHMLRVWNDESQPAALRVQATQKISQTTADQIRALLNDEQRKKYIKPHDHGAGPGVASGDVETWMSGKAPKGTMVPNQ